MRGSSDRVLECTSSSFHGTIALCDARGSWVAKWQRIGRNVRGLYAIRVDGALPDEVVNILEDSGASYVPRDGRTMQ